jgi:hypothetical protein
MEEKIKELKYVIRNVETVGSDTFVGHSLINTLDDSNLWIIKKVSDVGGLTYIKYAKGSWTNKVSLSYT